MVSVLSTEFGEFKISIIRSKNGIDGSFDHWNGYVELPRGFDIQNREELDVHGGVTFFRKEETTKGRFVTVGFDTCHSTDGAKGTKNYKDLEFVLDECVRLCKQIDIVYYV